MTTRKVLFCTLAAVLLQGNGCGDGPAEDERGLEQSVLQIRVGDGWGTGFAVQAGDEVLVATAYHVVMNGDPIVVFKTYSEDDKRYQGAFLDAVVEVVDAKHDLALLSIPGAPQSSLKPLQLAEKSAVQGTQVRAAGFPATLLTKSNDMGLVLKPPSSVPPGAVISVVPADATDPSTGKVIEKSGQTLLVVNVGPTAGNSGGPLLDENGEVVGVVILGDPVHKSQDGAVDVKHLRDLVARVVSFHGNYSKFPDDLNSAKSSLLEALKGSLSTSAISTGAPGEFLLVEERMALKEILKDLLTVYSSLPEDRNPDAFQNLFRLFTSFDTMFTRSRMISYDDYFKSCAADVAPFLAEGVSASILGTASPQVIDCMADRMVSDFSLDVAEAMLMNGVASAITELTLTDRGERRFRAQVQSSQADNNTISGTIPMDFVLRRGGWRLSLINPETGGLAGRFNTPPDYLAARYESVCLPKTASDCELNESGQRRLGESSSWSTVHLSSDIGRGFKLAVHIEEEAMKHGQPRGWISVYLGYVRKGYQDGVISLYSFQRQTKGSTSWSEKLGTITEFDLDQSGNVKMTSMGWGNFVFHRK